MFLFFLNLLEHDQEEKCSSQFAYLQGPCNFDCECVSQRGLRCDLNDGMCKCFNENMIWSFSKQMCIDIKQSNVEIDFGDDSCKITEFYDLETKSIIKFFVQYFNYLIPFF